MKICPNCKAQLNDDATFCMNCGTQLGGAPNPQPNAYPQPMPMVDPTDHTAEFSADDIHDNKLFAALVYASGILGIVIALIVNISNQSAYLKFHIKQGMKLFVANLIVTFFTAVLFWTFIVPFAGGVCLIILVVVQIICFVKTLGNKSIEPPIIKGIGFLK